jgi:hypothetical protein
VVRAVLASAGQPLDASVREALAPQLGDLHAVRVHADASAARSARSMGARAYAEGEHVVFGPGEYAPRTDEGRWLLVHELAHVVQQRASPALAGAILLKPKDAAAEALKAELKRLYDLSDVTDDPTDPNIAWTADELKKMKAGLARVPAAEKVALKGVELRRVKTTTDFGSIASGLFKRDVDRTGARHDRIEISNKAFEEDADGGGTLFMGQAVQGEASESTVAHEVGHAVEAFDERQTEAARFAADTAETAADKGEAAAEKAFDDAAPGAISVAAGSNAAEAGYATATKDAASKLRAIRTALNGPSATAAEAKTRATAVKRAIAAAKTAIDARVSAAARLPAGSTFAQPDVETAEDAQMQTTATLASALDTHAAARDTLEHAVDAKDAAETKLKVSGGAVIDVSVRLAEFVAVVELSGVKIKDAGLSAETRDAWPDNPAEAYAELYSLSLTSPEGLKRFDRRAMLADYFTSPVGVKSAQRRAVSTFLASHRGP